MQIKSEKKFFDLEYSTYDLILPGTYINYINDEFKPWVFFTKIEIGMHDECALF